MIKTDEIVRYVSEHICEFHIKRLTSLQSQNIKKLLRRKNPYLFRAKNIWTAPELVCTILDAHLSSAEETIYLAIF
jgi:hypothetical protein